MDLKRVAKLIDLMATSPLVELEIEGGDGRIRLVKRGAAIAAAAPGADAGSHRLSIVEASPAVTAAADVAGGIVVSPMVGTFYRAAAPGEAPFVAEGDAVESGQTLGLIEAMKTLCKIPAETSGRVRRILAADGAAVDEGQPLFEIA
jgi:acetyl-CoA carboxylase biotin carboxyl carrier protein